MASPLLRYREIHPPDDHGKLLKKERMAGCGGEDHDDTVEIFLRHRYSTEHSSAVFLTQGYFFKLFDVRGGML